MKLTTEQKLAYHLAHGVTVTYFNYERVTSKLYSYNFDAIIKREPKPHLRPLSSLTKPITVEGHNDGQSFVPIEELCRIFYGHSKTLYRVSNNEVFVLCENRNGESLYIHKDVRLIDFWIVEWLLKWQFNLFFEEGEYVQITDDNNG